MDPDKAPGPDGFSIIFYHTFWATIKRDLKKMLNYTLQKQKLGGTTNSTFLALIPKDTNPSNFSCFRPISLCTSSYKILRKIISNHLKPMLSKLIIENQGGFLKNKQIIDNIALVQEAIHSSMKSKDPGMVIKMDMANTFYRVKNSLLFSVLKSYGFSETLISWIKAYIGSPWINPLINGHPPFSSKKAEVLDKVPPFPLPLYPFSQLS